MIQKRDMKEIDPHRGIWIMMMAFLIMIALSALPVTAYDTPPGTIDPATIPKFQNVLTGAPPVWVPYHSDSAKDQYVINMSQFEQQILPTGFPTTTVWGYGGQAKDAVTGAPLGFVRNAPAGTFEAQKGKEVEVKWVNDLTGPNLYAVDPTLHWASPNASCMLMDQALGILPSYPPGFIGTNNQFGCNAQSPVPTVVHLHGAEVQSTSDGGPDQWFTASGIHGKDYFTAKKTDKNAAIYEYPNTQPPTTLFYHDHALGMTRINVFSGLVGFYLLRDPGKEPNLTADKKYEIPLAIQDRIFQANDNLPYWNRGDFYFYPEGNSVADHPYWQPEYFGNTIMVNGLIWPKMNVDQTRYRLRMVDGSNARFYEIHFIDNNNNPVQFYQVGTDGGYMPHPVPLTKLLIAPGERADIVIDFTGVNGPVTMTNTAAFPYPSGDDPVPGVDGTIMRFDIGNKVVASPQLLATATLNANIPDLSLTTPSNTRIRTLVEIANATVDTPIMVTLNGQRWMGALSETPAPGAIEDWVIVDTTMDTHPIHTHLTQFQLQSRQYMDTESYLTNWTRLQWTNCTDYGLTSCGSLPPGKVPPWPNNYIPKELPIGPYLQGGPIPPDANERGVWKDTLQMSPDQVTTIRIRWQALDNSGHVPNWYAFDPTIGQGYVWHCHIIDHEDNEMMRPYKVVRTSPPGRVTK
jgi:FtsP/CotA-like multicopper oxidase with cupredoxin domain